MNFIWNLYGVLTLSPIFISTMQHLEKIGDLCIKHDQLIHKLESDINKLKQITQLKNPILNNAPDKAIELGTHEFLKKNVKKLDFCWRVWYSCFKKLEPKELDENDMFTSSYIKPENETDAKGNKIIFKDVLMHECCIFISTQDPYMISKMVSFRFAILNEPTNSETIQQELENLEIHTEETDFLSSEVQPVYVFKTQEIEKGKFANPEIYAYTLMKL